MNGLHKRWKGTSVSTFDFSTMYIKLPHNELLLVLNSLIYSCFDGGENGARWVKKGKDNVIRLNKQQIKDSIAYLFSNCSLTAVLPIYFYIFMKVSG